MTQISNFIKKFKISTIASSLLIATLFLAMIAGVAMAFQTGETSTTPAKYVALTAADYAGLKAGTFVDANLTDLSSIIDGTEIKNGVFGFKNTFTNLVNMKSTTSVTTVGLIHTAYGLATLVLTAITIVGLIAYMISKNFLPKLRQWRETDAGITTFTITYTTLFVVILALMSVALALH